MCNTVLNCGCQFIFAELFQILFVKKLMHLFVDYVVSAVIFYILLANKL